ncbi:MULTISPECIES: tRNA (adenosine(37)-N6)-threonylcarbamoyltransferase complex dimerization subunit type 1 TsaB [unclassified Ruminococcus]|uniref:tRNA (adenosine(37)-N6)-threonylcarbamoyltransferase complex dimerization subunit type 1 TsaB n=1 Tax=unclassified Ruminococcus TaxID=2608920 RepID=UPI00210E3627|nr:MULTISPECIES: tRNA (adenosine(37)-N6)-threonylcarbamoyltransferase complex dimerization subunit type 1 TsaB [unclassified Ruminococcus]MCQ4022429.1 tRNA (adenosine(37)-N6)-threonylcarbamoyltransferase complex dimerization subunit type 1 TsaB [Ruminococcus sp. zg-924]MCQ4114757.1 tRNA (adenosine(37)-N6)-threonylcarbamoyltransferase complex dimerization subunit type 1 TsaB [Ruminococcus sp. zg-921]
MKILAFDSSAVSASVALVDDGKLLGETYLNVGLTHSATLMPMVEQLLKASGYTLDEIDALAVSAGPGSFTGLRIAVSCVKGMAAALGKRCVSVSTLEAMAYNLPPIGEYTICAVMDARCKQFYNALFKVENGEITRLCDDRAIMADKLGDELKDISGDIVLVGDGSALAYSLIGEENNNVKLPPQNLRFQKASSVAAVAIKKYSNDETISAAALMPSYLRLSQAERELIAKNKGEKK